MNEGFLEYFRSIGIREPILQRIETVLGYAKRLCEIEEFIDVEVSEYLEADGSRRYEKLRLYGEEKCVTAVDFMNREEFYVWYLREPIVGVKIESKDYDFKKATEKSRLTIVTYYAYPITGEHKGSMENCDHLMKMYEKYIFPFLVFGA